MKLHHVVVPALAIFAGSYLIPNESVGFVLNGDSLGLSQRDFRIFDNFTDSAANNNNVADANFPGYFGAEMAMWKAGVEWGSRLHGTGGGDPTQSSSLGSGGANFDPSFQGNANGVGNINQNVISEISSTGGSTLAFAEAGFGGYSSGWRIRFLSHWLWTDGPGSTTNGEDLQGIQTHEYGHALGLGHSASSSATMFGTASGNGGIPDRSISSDDIAGIQAIYGAAAANKPIITGHEICDGTITVFGSNFSNFNNEIWFTQAGSGGNGVPIKVLGVAANAGLDEVSATIPGNAGDGDILVKNGNGNGFGNLSNAWPVDISEEGDCGTDFTAACFGDGGLTIGCTDCPCGNNAAPGDGGGCLNGVGVSCVLIGSGVASISADTLRFDVLGCNPQTFANLQSGANLLPNNPANPCPQSSGVQSALFDGLRCIGGAVLRHGTRGTDAFGANSAPWGFPGNPQIGFAAQGGFLAGQTRNWQVIYREQVALACGRGLNTSQAVSMTWAP